MKKLTKRLTYSLIPLLMTLSGGTSALMDSDTYTPPEPDKSTIASQQVKPGEVPEGLTAAAWDSVQNQIRLSAYKARPNEAGGYDSANLANGFRIAYEADGTTTLRPAANSSDYHIGMRLSGIGYDDLQPMTAPTGLHSEALSQAVGSKVTYTWSDNVTEWWINEENRLEQWFSLKEAPAGREADAPLRLRLTLDSDMDTRIQPDHLTFSKTGKNIRYDKFKAWDATGKHLAVHFEGEGEYLDLVVADQAAVYPLTIDPTITAGDYIKASDTAASNLFGSSVAIDGQTMVVGSDASKSYVFTFNGSEWIEQAILTLIGAVDGFGSIVAISGETIVVGSAREGSNSGAVYVFVRTGGLTGTWSQQAYLRASNPGTGDLFSGDFFGGRVAISGETIVVGAYNEDSNATGVNGDQTDNSATTSGAAYVFVRTGGLTGTWSQQAYLKASNTDIGDSFGIGVAISGETIAVGAHNEDSNAIGINGDQTDNSASASGAVYVFVRTGGLTGTWSQQAYLKASNTGSDDHFGRRVAISGETIVMGAYGEDSNATGVNGDQTNNSASRSGAAYVFTRTGGLTGTWTQQAYLKASNTEYFDAFGYRVSISGETIAVSAYNEDSNATGVNGDQTNNSASVSGAAYVFTRTGGLTGTWTQQAYLKASNTDADDYFGVGIANLDGFVVVSAHFEDGNATGINGNQADNSAPGAGAIYTFGTPPADTDGDGTSDATDNDDDNDGISDADEGATGTNPLVADPASTDTDGDGLTDANESDETSATITDTNGNGVSDANEALDTDGDGTPNATDTDDDNDGISDADEGATGTNPLVADPASTDTDGDGLTDANESDETSATITDTNGNGVSDANEALDTDGDGTPDATDTDDDNDGVNDIDEALVGTDPLNAETITGTPDGSIDTDGDGIDNGTESDETLPAATDVAPANGHPDITTALAVDTDGDGTPDATDTDDDNDGVNDSDEALAGTDPLDAETTDGTPDGSLDTDGDGLDNATESDETLATATDAAPADGSSDILTPLDTNDSATKVLEYRITYSDADQRYDVYMRPTATPVINQTLTGQVTIQVPTGSGFSVTALINHVPGATWKAESRNNAPAANPGKDYLSFTLSGSGPFPWQNAQALKIFSFAASSCPTAGDVRLMEPDDTTFAGLPDNHGNQFTNLGWGDTQSNNYLGNYGGPADCRDNDGDGLSNSQEAAYGTDPDIADTDGDTLSDGEEARLDDGDSSVIDTDGDGLIDPLDNDDDGDTVLTRYEDPDGDGDLSNDDTDGDGTPNYLDNDDDGDSLLTATEHPDINGDGNPADAQDSDNDGIPDYLDNQTEILMNTRVWLQGASHTDGMIDTLREAGFLPTQEPYSQSIPNPFSEHNGNETLSAELLATEGMSAPVDWVMIELRDAVDPAQVLASQAAVVLRDSRVVDAASGSDDLRFDLPGGNYQIAVRHRNHLGAMTLSAVTLSGNPVLVDFASPDLTTWGQHARLISDDKAILRAGDSNHDGRIVTDGPSNDLTNLLSGILSAPGNAYFNVNYIVSGYQNMDLSLDGQSIFSGVGNDSNLALGNVLLHPENSAMNGNHIITEQIPQEP